MYSALLTFSLQSPHGLYSSPLRPGPQPAIQSFACPSIRGYYVWRIGLEFGTSLFCPVWARSREKQLALRPRQLLSFFSLREEIKPGNVLSVYSMGRRKKFPTALACVCGMKHFSTGVGLVLNLQVGETLNWVTIMERM